jgi:hypothetical protein
MINNPFSNYPKNAIDELLINSEIEFLLKGDAYVIAANREGLMYLSFELARIASSDDFSGAHCHFDEASGIPNKCDKELVIVLNKKN